jgi:peptide/nickel transport system permease protein
LAQKVVRAVFTALGISVVTFLILHLTPGSPALIILGASATPKAIAAMNRSLGLNQPIPVQYLTWLGNILHGNLGTSIFTNSPVLPLILSAAGATLILVLSALLISSVLGIVAGVLAAYFRGRAPDRLVNAGAVLGIAVPEFWLGLLLILAFAVAIPLFPSAGMTSFTGSGGLLSHLVLPSLTLAAGRLAITARLTRSSVVEVLKRDYVRTAYAKGASTTTVMTRHALRTALVPIVTVLGLQMGYIVGGDVVVEYIFSWPGIGNLLLTSVSRRDFPVIQGAVLLIGVSVVVVNLLVDVFCMIADPRVRAQ